MFALLSLLACVAIFGGVLAMNRNRFAIGATLFFIGLALCIFAGQAGEAVNYG